MCFSGASCASFQTFYTRRQVVIVRTEFWRLAHRMGHTSTTVRDRVRPYSGVPELTDHHNYPQITGPIQGSITAIVVSGAATLNDDRSRVLARFCCEDCPEARMTVLVSHSHSNKTDPNPKRVPSLETHGPEWHLMRWSAGLEAETMPGKHSSHDSECQNKWKSSRPLDISEIWTSLPLTSLERDRVSKSSMWK